MQLLARAHQLKSVMSVLCQIVGVCRQSSADDCLGHFILHLAAISAKGWYSQPAVPPPLQWLPENHQIWSYLWQYLFWE